MSELIQNIRSSRAYALNAAAKLADLDVVEFESDVDAAAKKVVAVTLSIFALL